MTSRGETDRDSPSDELCRAVIRAVSDAEGVDPEDLESPLYEAIDPDALDGLFAGRANTTGRIVFRYHGYTVTVSSDDRVDLAPRDG